MVRPDPSVLPKTLSEEFTRLSLKKVFFQENQDLSDNEGGDVFFISRSLHRNVIRNVQIFLVTGLSLLFAVTKSAFVYWEGIGGKKSRNCKRIL